jgi:hypothetical protein
MPRPFDHPGVSPNLAEAQCFRMLERAICPVLGLFPGERGMRRTEGLPGIREEMRFERLLEPEGGVLTLHARRVCYNLRLSA